MIGDAALAAILDRAEQFDDLIGLELVRLSMAALCAMALPVAWYGLTEEALRPAAQDS